MSEKLLKENDWRRTADCLAKDENLVAAWVFGSAREGIVRPGADIDIGVFFVRKPSIDELADLRTALQDSLSFDEIDLVVLHEASPILRFEAVSGRSVYTADMAAPRYAAGCGDFQSVDLLNYKDSPNSPPGQAKKLRD